MQIQEFDYFPLKFDKDGALIDAGQINDLKQHASGATDAIFLAHGFRNDENDSTTLYTNFLTTFRAHLSRPEFHEVAGRKFVVAAISWPSKPFKETFQQDGGSVQAADDDTAERIAVIQQLQSLKAVAPEHSATLDQAIALLPVVKDNAAAQDKFTDLVLSLLDGSELDSTEGLQQIRQQQGSELLDKLSTPIIVPLRPADNDGDSGGGVAAVGDFGGATAAGAFESEGSVLSIGSFFGSVFGKIGQFLNLTTWYIMKNRSGVVGATGVAQAVRDLRQSNPAIKIHLVGHSLGGRLMAGCAKSLSQSPMLQPDSLTLLEAAFSHYGFSDNNGEGTPGFFRDVIVKQVVKGPLVETFSFQDTVVGTVYAVASRLAQDNAQAIGDANDPFGGIGRNGAQKTRESVTAKLQDATIPGVTPYHFQPRVVNCLDGSGGLIKDHGDVTNPSVTYAFASAVAMT